MGREYSAAEIERMANYLIIEMYGTLEVVPNPFMLAQKFLGISIEMVRKDLFFDGWLVMRNNDAVIRINANMPTYRQRFTCGHEIGHFMLHRSMQNTSVDCLTGYGPLEKNADFFAACFLMPEESLRLMVPADNSELLSTARHFGVSISALKRRFLELGISAFAGSKIATRNRIILPE